MLSNQHFYHRITRKMVVAFGTMFNNIRLVRYDKTGTTEIERVTVPLSYSSKEKFYKRITQDPELTKETAITLPRMGFTLDTITYDPSRKLSLFNNSFTPKLSNGNLQSTKGIPYNFNFTLSVYVRNVEDGTQIIEQILPHFNPDYTLSIQLTSDSSVKNEVPIILDNITKNTDAYGVPDDTRVITWDLNFTMKGYFYGPILESKLIRSSTANTFGMGGAGGGDQQLYSVNVTPNPLSANPADDFGFTTNILDLSNFSATGNGYSYTQSPEINPKNPATNPQNAYSYTQSPTTTTGGATNPPNSYSYTDSPPPNFHSVLETHPYAQPTNGGGSPSCILPSNLQRPTISGVKIEGQTLTATNGNWKGTSPLTYTYQWYRAPGTIITNATSSTYTITGDDVGFSLFVNVIVTNQCGTAAKTSTNTSIIQGICVPPVNTSIPTISGLTIQDQLLTASHGTWTGTAPITYAYQWNRGGTPISGATSSTYLLGSSDVGFTISVDVSATNQCGTVISSSAVTSTIQPNNQCVPPVNTSIPTISNISNIESSSTIFPGNILSATNGTWTGTAPITYTYQWYKTGYDPNLATLMEGFDIPALSDDGAFGISYEASINPYPYVGAVIRIDGTSGPDGFTIVGHYSGKLYKVIQMGQGVYSPTGDWYPSMGHWMKLTELDGTPIQTNYPSSYMASFPLQFFLLQQANIQISGATSSTYTVTNDDLGAQLWIDVFATNDCGASEAISNNTYTVIEEPVIGDPPVNIVPPVISGALTGEQGFHLSTENGNGTWTGTEPITYTYQWYIDGLPAADQTYSQFYEQLNGVDAIGKSIYLVVTATNIFGSSSAQSNTYHSPSIVTTPQITGTLRAPSTLTVSGEFSCDGNPTIPTYQWYRYIDANPPYSEIISGATGATYTLTQADYDAGNGYTVYAKCIVTSSCGNGTLSYPVLSGGGLSTSAPGTDINYPRGYVSNNTLYPGYDLSVVKTSDFFGNPQENPITITQTWALFYQSPSVFAWKNPNLYVVLGQSSPTVVTSSNEVISALWMYSSPNLLGGPNLWPQKVLDLGWALYQTFYIGCIVTLTNSYGTNTYLTRSSMGYVVDYGWVWPSPPNWGDPPGTVNWTLQF